MISKITDVIKEKYDVQLAELLQDEDKIKFFFDLISDEIWKSPTDRKEVLDFMIEYCERNNLEVAAAWMYYLLAWHKSEESENVEAISLLQKAKDTFIFNSCTKGLLNTYNGLIYIYCDLGRHDLATKIGNPAIIAAEESNERDILLKILLSTAYAYFFAEDYAYSKKVLEIIRNKFDDLEIFGNTQVVYYNLWFEVELNLGNVSSAVQMLNTVRELMLQTKELYYNAEFLKLKGLFYLKTQEPNESEQAFTDALAYSGKAFNYSQQCQILIYWANLKFEFGQAEEGAKKLNEALDIAIKNNCQRHIKTLSYKLYSYYDSIDEYDLALENLERYYRVGELLSTEDSSSSNVRSSGYIQNLLVDRNEILYVIGEKIISTFNPMDMITEIKEEIRKIIPFDFFGITLYDEEKQGIFPTVYEFDKIYEHVPVKFSSATTFSEACINLRRPIVISDIEHEYMKYIPYVDLEGRGIDSPNSLVFIPLLANNQMVGTMTVQSLKKNAYTSDDVNTLKIIASYIALSLRNSLKYKKLEEAAVYDSLTGFFSKSKILSDGTESLRKCISENTPVSIAMIDIDDFKTINDQFGHLNGDRAITQIASAIKNNISKDYLIGRYGGDEFLIVAAGATIKELYSQADKMRKAVAETAISFRNNLQAFVSISIGVCQCYEPPRSLLDAIDIADRALYNAKQQHKNTVVSL